MITIKTFPISKGNLYFSPVPNDKSDLEQINKLNLDCIFNLAEELKHIIPLEEKVSKMVISGNIPDYDIPQDKEVFYKQIEQICEMLNNNKSVLIHCYGGRGRTGMALLCISLYMERKDFNETWQLVRKLTRGGPERDCQVNFAREFNDYLSSK